MTNDNWKYTELAERVMVELKADFDFYYSRECMEAQLEKFLKAKKKDTNYTFIKLEFEEMLGKCRIEKYDLNNHEEIKNLISKLPSEEEIYKSVFRKMYDISKRFKGPKDYMERLVRRLADKDFRFDPVRLAILKQFIKYTNYNTRPIIDFVVASSGEKVPDGERMDFVLRNIDESIFDVLQADSGEVGQERDFIRIEAGVLCSKFENELKEISDEVFEKVKVIAEGKFSSDDSEKYREEIDAIKNSLIDSPKMLVLPSGRLNVPVEMASKADFLLLAECSCADEIHIKEKKKAKKLLEMYSGYSPELPTSKKIALIIDNYEDMDARAEENALTLWFNEVCAEILHKVKKERSKLFNHYNNERKKDFRKSSKKTDIPVTLLKLADDLANGNFYTNGKTKNSLYMFAFAFNMTSSLNGEYNELTDIEKNLFHDYYNHNLMNYIQRDSRFEAEPTGSGINIKNYVELIYLYYLSVEGMSPGEKIENALNTVAKCEAEFKKRAKEGGIIVDTVDATEIYRKRYADVMALDRDALVEYICNNYYYNRDNKAEADITFASEELAAYENFEYIIRLINLTTDGMNGDYLENVGIEDIDSVLSEIGTADENFREVLLSLNKMLADKVELLENPSIDKKKIKRSDIIALAYYYKLIESSNMDFEERKNFAALYEDFCEFVNPYLEDSRYQKLSFKNIFDAFVVICLYRLSDETPYEIIF